jgi:hypothetical protein
LETLPENKKAFVFNHYPLAAPSDFESYLMNINWRFKVMELIRDYHVLAYFSGHVHEPFAAFQPTYQLLNLGGPSTTHKNAFHLICLDDQQVSLVYVNNQQTPVVVLTAPENHWGEGQRGKVSGFEKIRAKVFPQNPVARVECQIDTGTWQPLPLVGSNLYEKDFDFSQLSLGNHSLQVRAIDNQSNTAHHQISILVTETIPPTPTVDLCPNKEKGNLNCDSQGLINHEDLALLLNSWAPWGPIPSPSPYQASPDLNKDSQVNEADLTILLLNWKD